MQRYFITDFGLINNFLHTIFLKSTNIKSLPIQVLGPVQAAPFSCSLSLLGFQSVREGRQQCPVLPAAWKSLWQVSAGCCTKWYPCLGPYAFRDECPEYQSLKLITWGPERSYHSVKHSAPSSCRFFAGSGVGCCGPSRLHQNARNNALKLGGPMCKGPLK